MDIKPAAAYLPPEIAAALLTTATALEIADESARCSVETECARGQPAEDADHVWWDTLTRMGYDDPEVRELTDAEIARALQYLELRSMIARHPLHPALVRFVVAA